MAVHSHSPTDPAEVVAAAPGVPPGTASPPRLATFGARCAIAAPVLAMIAIAVGAPIYTTPMATAALTSRLLVANAATLGVLLLVVVVAAGMLVRGERALGAVGQGTGVVALVGTVLAAGGAWDSLFSLPYVAEGAPDLLAEPTGGTLLAGFLLSYAVLAIGWFALALACRRSGLLSRGATVAVCVASVLALVPAPTALRLLPLSLALAWSAWSTLRR